MTRLTRSFTSAGLFCGIGGFCRGFEEAGFDNLWANDLDPDVALTYPKNYEATDFIREDLNQLDLDKLPAVDVLHGGFPCQSFSQAGNRKGFDDPRGQLFLTMMDKISRMSEKPKVLVFENSPYIKIGGRGSWFSQVVFRIRKAGYHFSEANCFELDARLNGGSPQSRKRLFMVAVRKDLSSHNPFIGCDFREEPVPLESILDRDSIDDDYYFLDDENKYSKMVLSHAKSSSDKRIFQLRKTIIRVQAQGECPTLTANMGAGGHNVPFIIVNGRVRKLTERECLRLQRFPDEFKFPADMVRSCQYRMIGNSICVTVSRNLAKFINIKLSELLHESNLDFSA